MTKRILVVDRSNWVVGSIVKVGKDYGFTRSLPSLKDEGFECVKVELYSTGTEFKSPRIKTVSCDEIEDIRVATQKDLLGDGLPYPGCLVANKRDELNRIWVIVSVNYYTGCAKVTAAPGMGQRVNSFHLENLVKLKRFDIVYASSIGNAYIHGFNTTRSEIHVMPTTADVLGRDNVPTDGVQVTHLTLPTMDRYSNSAFGYPRIGDKVRVLASPIPVYTISTIETTEDGLRCHLSLSSGSGLPVVTQRPCQLAKLHDEPIAKNGNYDGAEIRYLDDGTEDTEAEITLGSQTKLRVYDPDTEETRWLVDADVVEVALELYYAVRQAKD